MPITKSAQKALRQNLRRRERNKQRKQALKEVKKKFLKLIEAEQIEEAKKLLPRLYKALDKAAKVHLIKKGKSNRLKSRLARKLS
ncbi:30S ribosomal protein S20 [bacterium]|nr:30S ribosomal protein S20 [bacterium]